MPQDWAYSLHTRNCYSVFWRRRIIWLEQKHFTILELPGLILYITWKYFILLSIWQTWSHSDHDSDYRVLPFLNTLLSTHFFYTLYCFPVSFSSYHFYFPFLFYKVDQTLCTFQFICVYNCIYVWLIHVLMWQCFTLFISTNLSSLSYFLPPLFSVYLLAPPCIFVLLQVCVQQTLFFYSCLYVLSFLSLIRSYNSVVQMLKCKVNIFDYNSNKELVKSCQAA